VRRADRITLERQLREHPDGHALVKLISPVIRAVQDVVEARTGRKLQTEMAPPGRRLLMRDES